MEQLQPVKANIATLTSLLSHTIYFKKELFLRELICNALDAINRVKLVESYKPKESYKPRIEIISIPNINILIVKDNGIGMTQYDLENYLGTICSSGTKQYVESLGVYTEATEDLIGMFGIGFRSCYAVSKKISIKTKHINAQHNGYVMTFGEYFKSFRIESNDEKPVMQHGTQIILTIDEDNMGYMAMKVAKNVVDTYFKLIQFPIYFGSKHKNDNLEDIQFTLLNKFYNVVNVHNVMNSSVSSDDIDDKTYNMFYKYICNGIEYDVDDTILIYGYIRITFASNIDNIPKEIINMVISFYPSNWNEFMIKKRFFVEGQLEFGVCLFIPNHFSEMDVINHFSENSQLFIKKIFISNNREMIAEWLNFVKVIVNSCDMPLNISKTALCQSKINKLLRKNIVRKAVQAIMEFADNNENEYIERFYRKYNRNVKLALLSDWAYRRNRIKLVQLLRFKTTKSNDKLISIVQYIQNMKQNQKYIYYADKNDSKVVKYLKLDIEVLYFDDQQYDDYFVDVCQNQSITLNGFGLNLKSVSSSD